MDARVLSHAERGVRCFGIASSDADGKRVFCFNLSFSNPLHPDTLDVIARASGSTEELEWEARWKALPVQFLVVQWCRYRYSLGIMLPNIEIIFSVSEKRSTKQACTDPRGLDRWSGSLWTRSAARLQCSKNV